jgi:type VI secretion system protein ImpF
MKDTLEVTAVASGGGPNAAPNTVSFEISGDLWAAPLPERFFIKTDIDLETGKCVM